MIARLQRATTLSLLAFAALWALAFGSRGAFGWAVAGAVLILLGYALFLAVEFALLTRFGSGRGTAVPTRSQLFRAWAGEVLRAPQVFCWRQPFRSKAVPDSVGEADRGRRGVVFVHGFVCNRGFWNPWLKRFRALGVPFMAVDLEPPFCSIDAYANLIEAAVERVRGATGLPPVVVAHSMGGLAVRAWVARYPGADRVHHVVTIASPHHGTWLGRFAVTTNGEQMHTGSDWLESLARTEKSSDRARYTCFYGHCDNIVFPTLTATLAGADNRHIPATAHVDMAFHPEVFREVLRWVDPAAPAETADPESAELPVGDRDGR